MLHALLICDIWRLEELPRARPVMGSVRPWLSQGLEGETGSVRVVDRGCQYTSGGKRWRCPSQEGLLVRAKSGDHRDDV